MIECLNCKKEFESKSPLAKFCGVTCRVAYHREHGKNKSITPLQMQVLYNTMMEKLEGLSKVQFTPVIQTSYDGKMVNPTHDEPLKFELPKTGKNFQQFMNELSDLMYEEEFKNWASEVQSSVLLSQKQKDLLIQNMRQSKL